MQVLRTDRLILREWRDADRAPFAAMNADPRVMEFFPRLLSPAESEELAGGIEQHFSRYSFGLYAAELAATHMFIGYIGLAVPNFSASFTPCVEIGWRLSADYWGKGLATEGSRAVVSYGFHVLALNSLVSFTAAQNVRSRRVMEKLGMTYSSAEDFDHPSLPAGHPLQRHVVYRLEKEEWRKGQFR